MSARAAQKRDSLSTRQKWPYRKIVSIRVSPLLAKLPVAQRTSQGHWEAIQIVIVEIETDDGLMGVGECLSRRAPGAAKFIETALAPLLIGEDPLDRRRLWNRMRSVLSGLTGGMLVEAIAGVDIALWDIAGKAAGLPVSKLLGGVGRGHILAYASSINWTSDEGVEREIAAAVKAGFRHVKVKIGRPVRDAVARVKFARKVAGDAIELSVDANWAYDVDDALIVGRALEDNGYEWFEEPIRPEDRAGYRILRDKLRVRLAAGESEFTAMGAAELMQDRSIGLIQPDVARSGGISETWRIAELAQSFNIAYAPHVGWSGAVCVAASLQLAGAAENCRIFECMVYDNPLRQHLLRKPVGDPADMLDGALPIPDAPGIGATLDRDALKEFLMA